MDYGWPAHTHGEYRAPGFKACAEDRTLPTSTMIITESKAQCKEMHEMLLTRPGYQALMYRHVHLRVPFKVAVNDRAYGAKIAYAFRYCTCLLCHHALHAQCTSQGLIALLSVGSLGRNCVSYVHGPVPRYKNMLWYDAFVLLVWRHSHVSHP